jgi:hypothetical protein
VALGICLGYFVSDPIDSPVCRIAITGHYHSLETFVRQIYDVLAGWFHSQECAIGASKAKH